MTEREESALIVNGRILMTELVKGGCAPPKVDFTRICWLCCVVLYFLFLTENLVWKTTCFVHCTCVTEDRVTGVIVVGLVVTDAA